ncbi:MAG: transposase [Pirellulales bacterium]
MVIVRFADRGWAAYYSTDPDLSAREIMETISARWAIEETFHDLKEVRGAGQQQVRNVWSNIACWHLNQWCYALVELATWDTDPSSLIDRSDRPWDNPTRRPSHADRRRTISREMLRETYLAVLPAEPEPRQFQAAIESLIAMCA